MPGGARCWEVCKIEIYSFKFAILSEHPYANLSQKHVVALMISDMNIIPVLIVINILYYNMCSLWPSCVFELH